MRLALSRRTSIVLASVVAVGGLLQLLAGRPAITNAADGADARSAQSPRVVEATQPATRQGGSSTLSPELAKLLLALAHRTTDASKAGDLFASHTWYVAPPPPPPPPPAPPAAPTAPPFPYTFVGSYNDGSSETVYFLTRSDRVYDVRPGDTLDQIYSVDGVENGQLVFTYKPLGIRQTLQVGGGS